MNTKRKTAAVIISVICALMIIAAIVLLPRMQIKNLAYNRILPGVSLENCRILNGGTAENVYALGNISMTEIENDIYIVSVPTELMKSQTVSENGKIYSDGQGSYAELMNGMGECPVRRIEDIDFKGIFNINMPAYDIRKGIAAMGKEYPDSEYELFKAAALLKEEDYSFSDTDRGAAFCTLAALRGIMSTQDIYVYENNGVCGIAYGNTVTYSESGKTMYAVGFDFYSENDLDKGYTINICTDSPETALDIISSVRFK